MYVKPDKDVSKIRKSSIDKLGVKIWKFTGRILLPALLLSGCNLMNKEPATTLHNGEADLSFEADKAEAVGSEKQNMGIKEERQRIDKEEGMEINSDLDINNNIYNSVKYYSDYFYFSDADGFKRMNRDQWIPETLGEGNVRLGNRDENFIYYIRYAVDGVKNAGVFRMDLAGLMEEKIMDWTESMWTIYNIYAHEEKVYFEGNNICEAYEIIDGKANRIDEIDNIVFQQLDKCGILHENIYAMAPGYINMMFQYHKLVYLNSQDNSIFVYDTDSGEKINTIEQCGSDILVDYRGIVYKDLENNILLREWGQEDSAVLYDMEENDNKFINYGTFDEQYIYGFYESDDECLLVRIKWEGGCEEGRIFNGVGKAVELEFSANNGVISFRQDGHRIFERK